MRLGLWRTPADHLRGAASASQRSGWVPTAKLRSFRRIIPVAPPPNQPGIDTKTESRFLSLLNQHSGSVEHAQGDGRLDEEVGVGCQLEVSKKPEARL